MFNQEDQLPAHSIITALESSQSYLQLESAAERLIDRVQPFQLTVAAQRPDYCQVPGNFPSIHCASCIRKFMKGTRFLIILK